jgi:hypothetical protein
MKKGILLNINVPYQSETEFKGSNNPAGVASPIGTAWKAALTRGFLTIDWSEAPLASRRSGRMLALSDGYVSVTPLKLT